MAANAPNEVEETIKLLKSRPGFESYIIMNNDGIVVKHEHLEYQEAIMYAYHVLSLMRRTKQHIQKLVPDPAENEVEWLRLRTQQHEIIITQHLRYTLVALQAAATSVPPPEGVKRSMLEEVKEEEKPVVATAT